MESVERYRESIDSVYRVEWGETIESTESIGTRESIESIDGKESRERERERV